jgi:DNA-binding NtrC family response regulator
MPLEQEWDVGLICAEHRAARADVALSAAGLRIAWRAHDLGNARAALRHSTIGMVAIDFELDPEGVWPLVIEIMASSQRPVVLVFGNATGRDAFRLAAFGVDFYFESLLTEELLRLRQSGTLSQFEMSLVAAARGSIGLVGVKEAQRLVRTEMFRGALHFTGGNRHATARILKVDRRYVLKMLTEQPDIACPHSEGSSPVSDTKNITPATT